MKKVFIASAIAMSMAAGSAMAAQQSEVTFFGNVTNKTCDITPEVGGSVTQTIQLGTALVGEKAKAVDFSLKATDPNDAGCKALDAAGTATVAWFGPFDSNGLINEKGSATNTFVELASKNAKTTNVQKITDSSKSVDFEANKVINGFEFTAMLDAQTVAGATPGTFETTAAYAVTYQ
ncbi:fimbrial protein [Escherichia coli]|nr:fimbrial protein [Escherichia coli]